MQNHSLHPTIIDSMTFNSALGLTSDWIAKHVSSMTSIHPILLEFKSDSNDDGYMAISDFNYGDIPEIREIVLIVTKQKITELTSTRNSTGHKNKVRLNEIRHEEFMIAITKTSPLQFIIFHPRNCRLPAHIPVIGGRYLDRKSRSM